MLTALTAKGEPYPYNENGTAFGGVKNGCP